MPVYPSGPVLALSYDRACPARGFVR